MIFSNLVLKEAAEAHENNTNNVDRGGDKGERGCTDWDACQGTAEFSFAGISTAKDTEKGYNKHGKKGDTEHQPAPHRVCFPDPPILHHLSLVHGGVVDVGPLD